MSVPAKKYANVQPATLQAGGASLTLSALVLSNAARAPIGQVLSFPNAAAVGAYFGLTSAEYKVALRYFAGFTTATVLPGAILFAQYNQNGVPAFLRGGSVASLTLAQLQAITGTLIVVVNGYTHTSANIDLSGATSFTSAAATIQTALQATPAQAATFTGSITATILTVASGLTGLLQPGNVLTGGTVSAGTTVVKQLTGTTPGGLGTYTVSASQTVTSGVLTANDAAPTVTYDTTAGALVVTSGVTATEFAPSTIQAATGTAATALAMTTATGAVTSQGAVPATPSPFMSALINVNANWATFLTAFDPDSGSGNANKVLFAQWNALQDDQFVYAAWDTDITPTLSDNATTSLGYIVKSNNLSGTIVIYEPNNQQLAAFVGGYGASLDFTRTNGRTVLKYRSGTGIVPGVTDATVAANLDANGYNYYVSAATAAAEWDFFANGSIGGDFNWADSYYNQIWLNSQFQTDLMLLLTQAGSIPYNNDGDTLIEQSLLDTITTAGLFGVYRAGVMLSALQAQEVNSDAGVSISGILSTRGWYLQSQAATTSPEVRALRGSPPCTFWYMDGGSVQSIDLLSANIQ